MTSEEHYAISTHCHDALDGRYDQHVFEAMMHHDGAGFMARIEEDKAAKAALRSAPAKASRKTRKGPFTFDQFRRSLLA